MKPVLFSLTIILAAALSGCGSKTSSANGMDEILVSTTDSTLTVAEVVARIPVGMNPVDSLELFNRLVYEWIESRVLADIAREKLPSTEEIDRRVEAFRNRLTVTEYLRQMSHGKTFKANPDSLQRFYEDRRHEMVSETPLVKGLLLKVPAGATGLNEIRRCVFEASSKSLDELESNWLSQTLQCEWFLTEWVDWDVLAETIPYRFDDPDAFLATNRNFETRNNGTVYLLHISEWLPSGKELPYEFAAPRIAAMYERANLASYEEALVRALIRKAMSEGKLKAGNYDPISGRRLRPVRKTNENKLNDEK